MSDSLNPDDGAICRCGHYQSLHQPNRAEPGNLICSASGCPCVQFEEVDLNETAVGQMLNRWIDDPTAVNIGKVMGEWVKAHGGAERFAREMVPDITREVRMFLELTPADRWAIWLWCRYYTLCEDYDRRVCSYIKDDGTSLPTNTYESALVNDNARKELKRLVADANTMGLTQEQLRAAKNIALAYNYAQQREIFFKPPEDINGSPNRRDLTTKRFV